MNIVPIEDFISFLGKYYSENALEYIKRKYKNDYVPIIIRYASDEEREDLSNCRNIFSFHIDDDKFPRKFKNVIYNISSMFALWLCNSEFQYEDEYEEYKVDEDYEVYDSNELIKKNKIIITDIDMD